MRCPFCEKNEAKEMFYSPSLNVPICGRCLTIWSTAMAAGVLFGYSDTSKDMAIMHLIEVAIIPADVVRHRGNAE